MSQTYTLHKDIIHSIFKKLIDAKAFNHKENAKNALQVILNDLDETAIETVATLMLKEEPYDVLSIGDYVEVEPPKYHPGSEFEEDVLSDMGLIKETGNPMVYALVIDDTSWSSSSNKLFNPFHSTIKVHLLYHDSMRKIKMVEYAISPLYVKKIDKFDIEYFRQAEAKISEANPSISL